MIQVAEELGLKVGVFAACQALGVSRSSLYRGRQQAVKVAVIPKGSARALSETERGLVRAELNSTRFQDQSPREIYATLIDEGRYLCSYRTMYRILEAHAEIRERRRIS